MLSWAVFLLFGFFSGGIMFSYLLPLKLKNIDITKTSDDNNPGAANAVKLSGWYVGLLCLFLDLCKGFLPVFIAFRYLDHENILFSFIMLAPVLGHAVAPFYKFRGGKAIAVSFGTIAALIPHSYLVFVLAFLYIFFSVIFQIKPITRRSIVTFSMFSVYLLASSFFSKMISFRIGSLMIALVVIYKHLKSIKTDSRVPSEAKL